MAGEIDSFLCGDSTATEPHFSTAFWGYARSQVDHYARTVEAQIAAILAANRDLEEQARALTTQVRLAQDEIGDLRRRPPTADKLAYRHLGARVEQILSEAEHEATTIRQSAIEDAERERSQLVTTLDEARADFERDAQQARDERDRQVAEMAEQRKQHADEERDLRRRLEAAKVDLIRAEANARRHRSDAAELLNAAQEAYDRLHASAMANAGAVQSDLQVKMQELRAQAYEEASSVALAAEIYALETVTAAEEHAESLRVVEAESTKRGTARTNNKAGTGAQSKHAAQRQNARKGVPGKAGTGRDAAEVPAPAAAAPVEEEKPADAPTGRVSSGDTPDLMIDA